MCERRCSCIRFGKKGWRASNEWLAFPETSSPSFASGVFDDPVRQLNVVMTKRNIFFTLVLVALAGFWMVNFSGWFATSKISITHSIHAPQQPRQANSARNGRRNAQTTTTAAPAQPVVTFLFNRAYSLTDLKIVSATALATNVSALPVWHLTTESNSVPLKTFTYGQYIVGMKPWVSGVHAQPLLPGETYKLIVEAGKRTKGEYEFKIPPERN